MRVGLLIAAVVAALGSPPAAGGKGATDPPSDTSTTHRGVKVSLGEIRRGQRSPGITQGASSGPARSRVPRVTALLP